FVSASTGPMHLAAAAGTPVLAFFSTRRVMGARRWGPLIRTRRFLTGASPECALCRAGDCARHDDPSRVAVQTASDAAFSLLDAGRPGELGLDPSAPEGRS